MQGKGRAGNFRKTHLRDVPSGHAQGVQCFGCIEIQHIPKIVILKVFGRIKAAAYHQHISDAGLQCPPVHHFHIVFVQFLQKTAFGQMGQLRKIIVDIILYRIFCRREKCRTQIVLLLQFSEAVFQCLDNVRHIFRAYRPQGNRPGEPAFMGIGNIKMYFSRCLPLCSPSNTAIPFAPRFTQRPNRLFHRSISRTAVASGRWA